MQERGCQLEDGPVKVLGAEIDFPILLAARPFQVLCKFKKLI